MTVTTSINKPTTSSSTSWFSIQSLTNSLQITINPNSNFYPVYTSSLGSYTITFTAQIPRKPSIVQSNSFKLDLIDPCDFGSVNQPTIPDFNVVWQTANSQIQTITPVLPVHKRNAALSCAPDSYDVNATQSTGTETLDSTTGLTLTKTTTSVSITMTLLRYDQVGVYNGLLTYNWNQGKSLSLSFKINVTPCILTGLLITPTWPAVLNFGFSLTQQVSYSVPLSTTQTPACGYPFTLSYTVNGTISTQPSNLVVDFSNQASPTITLKFTNNPLDVGTHSFGMKATSNIPAAYQLTMITSNSVSQDFKIVSCSSLVGPDIFVYPTNLPVGTFTINIGTQTNSFSFSNFTDTYSQSINAINACGKIGFYLWLNDVQMTVTSSTISFTQATISIPTNTINISTMDRSISPTTQVVAIQAYLEGTTFTSGFRNFTVKFVDQCSYTKITLTTALPTLSTTVLASTSQVILSNLQDNTTIFYRSSSNYDCTSYTFSLAEAPTTSPLQQLGSSITIDSTGLITVSPTLVEQVGTHSLTLTVSLSYGGYSSIQSSFALTAIVGYCVVTSYSMAAAQQQGSINPLLIEYTITQSSATYTYPQINYQTPACGYIQHYSSSSSTFSLLSGQTQGNIASGDYIFSISQFTDRQKAGKYSVILRSTIANYNASTTVSPSSSITINIVIYDACKDTVLVVGTITNLVLNVWNWDYATQQVLSNNQYTPIPVFTDSVSTAQSNASYCGSKIYTCQYKPIPATPLTTMNVVNQQSPTIQIKSDSLNQVGSYVVEVTGSLKDFANVTLKQDFTIQVNDSCWLTKLSVFTYPALIKTTVLAPSFVTSINEAKVPTDTLSDKVGQGTNLCGSKTFTLTTNDTNLSPSNGISIDGKTGAVTLYPLLKNQVGYFLVTVTLALDLYPNVTTQNTFVVQVFPCRILGVSMSKPSSQVYMLHPNNTWQMNYPRLNVTQNRTCGYGMTFTFGSGYQPLDSVISLTNSSDQTQAVFELKSMDRSLLLRNQIYDDRVFTITLTVQLIECFDPLYCSTDLNAPSDPFKNGNTFQVTTFNLTIQDPCKTSLPQYIQIEDMHSFAGYQVASRVTYTYTDTITSIYQPQSQYCGTFNFTFVDASTNQTITELNATQGDYWYYNPPSYTKKFGTVNVTVTAYQVEYYPKNYLNTTFFITTLGYTAPYMMNQVYYVNQSSINCEVGSFRMKPSNFTADDLTDSYLSFYQVDYTSNLYAPIDLIKLNAIDYNDSSVKDWLRIQVNDEDLSFTYSIFTSDFSLVDTYYKILVVQTFPLIQQSMFGSFLVQILQQAAPKIVIPPPDFIQPLEDQSISCNEDQSYSWSYQLPKAFSSTEGVTVSSVTGSCATDSLSYAVNSRTVSQIKYVSKNFATMCTFNLRDSYGNQNKKNFTVTFTCRKKANLTSTESSAFLDAANKIQKQKTSPSATISSIDKSGLMTITFNTTMKIPEKPSEIQTGKVNINGSSFQVVEITVIPGRYSNISNLAFTWTFVEFSRDNLKIQLKFNQPNQVSTQKEQDQIKVKIYGNHLFADYRGNYIQPETVLTKALSKQTMKSMADKFTALGLNTQNGVLSVLFTNTIMTVLVAGPINLILGAVKQLQITSHIMLVNLPTPANLNIFFSILMQLVTLNFIDTTNFVNKLMNLDSVNPFTDQFDEVGYGSLYVLQNLGTLAFIMFGTPPLLGLAYLLIRISKSQNLENYKTKIRNFLCFDGTISFLFESMLLFSICGFLNLNYFYWNTAGNVINSLLCSSFILICAAFPIVFAVFYSSSKIYSQIEARSETFQEKFGGVLESLNFLREGKKVLIYLVFTMYRKIVLSATCVYLNNYPLFSIFSQIWVAISMVIMLGYVRPFDSIIFNRVEMFNECCVVIHLYHSLCFTEFQPDMEWRDLTGFSLIASTVGNITINLSVVTYISLIPVARKTKLIYLKNKQRLSIHKKLKIKELEEMRKAKELQRLEQQEINRQNLLEWEKQLAAQREAEAYKLIEKKIKIERQKAEKAMQAMQVKEKKLQEKLAKQARENQMKGLKKGNFDQRGFPVEPPIDHSVYIEEQSYSTEKKVEIDSKSELLHPNQGQTVNRTLGYDFKKTQVAQMDFSRAIQEINYKPKILNAKKSKPLVPNQPRELTQWEKDNPEAARQRDELAKENAQWSKYDYSHYPFMAPEETITDPRFIGPSI